MFCFSVMESPFCFANVEFITVPAASFIDDLGPLRSVQAIFVWKKGFDLNTRRIKKTLAKQNEDALEDALEYNVYHRCLCYFLNLIKTIVKKKTDNIQTY